MPKSFSISPPAPDTLKPDAKGHAQSTYTVINTASRPVRGSARLKPMGDTKREWLSIAGETERDFGGGTSEDFTVSFDAPGAPAGKYPFRLDVASAQNPDEDFCEGLPITVEIGGGPPPPEKKKFPLWIILTIVGVVVIVGIIVLIIALSSGKKKKGDGDGEGTPTPVEATTPTPAPATPTPARPDREFRVTALTLAASPTNHAGPCPVKVTFSGLITANRAGTVKYTFVRSDGARDTRDLSLNFDGPGTKAVETDWTLGAAVPTFQPFRGGQRLKILSPNELESDNATFVLNCR